MQDESVDLIYLDPPFNSKRIYNASMGGAQWVAFKDTWQWHEASDDFHDVASDVQLSETMEGLRKIKGEGPDLAYLSYMANRLRECRRVLKPTGSIYLHCDPTMSHYLKVVMDKIFAGGGGGGGNFKTNSSGTIPVEEHPKRGGQGSTTSFCCIRRENLGHSMLTQFAPSTNGRMASDEPTDQKEIQEESLLTTCGNTIPLCRGRRSTAAIPHKNR